MAQTTEPRELIRCGQVFTTQTHKCTYTVAHPHVYAHMYRDTHLNRCEINVTHTHIRIVYVYIYVYNMHIMFILYIATY